MFHQFAIAGNMLTIANMIVSRFSIYIQAPPYSEQSSFILSGFSIFFHVRLQTQITIQIRDEQTSHTVLFTAKVLFLWHDSPQLA